MPCRATRLAALLPILSLITLPAFAQTLTVTPATAHPEQVATIAGSGFADAEAVDVYIDTTDTILLVSSSSGVLSGSVTLPASLLPGVHYITAIGRRSGDAAQVIFKVSTPWTELGYSASHRGWNPYENVLGTGTVGTLGPSWYGGSDGSGGTPVVDGGNVYMSTLNGLQGLSATTGATLWSILTGTTFYATPTYVGGTLYIGDGSSGNFYAIKASTHKTLWSVPLGSQIYSSAAVVNGVVYVATNAGAVYALNAATGASTDSSVTVVDGVVYYGSYSYNIYALNSTTGALLWSYPTGGAVESTPVVVNGVLYCGSDDDKVYAIRTVASTVGGEPAGSLIWSAETQSAVFDTVSVADGEVYAGSVDGNLYAFDAHTGATSWSFATPNSYPRSPAVANGIVYFTSNDGGLYAIAANGDGLLWYGSAGGAFFGSPAGSDGVLYVTAYQR